MPLNPNTSKKRLRNLEKVGGYDQNFHEVKGEKTDNSSLPCRKQNTNSYAGNRPQSKSRKTRTKAFVHALNRRKVRNGRK